MEKSLSDFLTYGNNQAMGQSYQLPSGYGYNQQIIATAQQTSAAISGMIKPIGGGAVAGSGGTLVLLLALGVGLALVAFK